LNSNFLEGIISAIDFIGYSTSEYQLYCKAWNDIPMFSVLTGLNGIGKSSILKYIKEFTDRVVNDKFITKDHFADLNINQRSSMQITFNTCCHVTTLLVDHNEAVEVNKTTKINSLIEMQLEKTIDDSKDSKISIKKLIYINIHCWILSKMTWTI